MNYRLNVPFREKDEAKAHGARWNWEDKYWYCTVLTDELRRWYDGPEDAKAEDVPDHATEAAAIKTASSINTASDASSDHYAEYRTVSEINYLITDQFEMNPAFRNILVKGEVTNYKGPNNGNYYFHIKDEKSLLSCVLWRSTAASALKFNLESGKQVAIAGSLTYSEKSGKTSLIVRQIADMGAGEANLKYLELKARLEAEGLFAPEHKKPIPKFPEKVGIVTSKNGQARNDIEKVAKKRNPYIQLILYHVNVQGVNAVSTILQGIKALDAMGLDTIIVGRGGGSDEELIAYNDEALARAVYEAKTPIISAVGHEGNWSLIDYVSDKRAATPSEAAEEAVPDIMTTVHRLEQLRKGIADNMQSRFNERKMLLQTQKAKLEGHDPVRILKDRQTRLSVLSDGIRQKMLVIFEAKKNRCKVLITELHGLSPTAKLVRGFGYITSDDRPVVSVADVKKGDPVTIRIHDGQINTTVESTMKISD